VIWSSILTTIIGLMLFEIVSSIDNAVINAEVLDSMPQRDRRWFLRWGLFFSGIIIRGVLPWLIIWLAIPSLGPLAALTVTVHNVGDAATLHNSASFLLMTGGTTLLLLFTYWAMVEHRAATRHHLARLFSFLVVAVILLAALMRLAEDGVLIRAIVVGEILFLILLVVKQLAALPHRRGKGPNLGRAKIIYVEVLDSVFSVEGVLGAFAFTFYVPFILIGNGIGAIIVRQVTARHGKRIREMAYLKHGAMYALCFIGVIMVLDGLGATLPGWFSLLTTTVAMGYSYVHERSKA